MKKVLLQIWLMVVTIYCAEAGKSDVRLSTPESWVKPVACRFNAELKLQDISQGYAYLLNDVQENLASQSHYYHYAVRVYNETGVQHASDLEITFQPYQELYFHYIRVIRNGKPIEKLLRADQIKVLQRETQRERYVYDHTASAMLTLDDVRAGDHIEYAYTIVGDNPAFEGRFSNYFSLQYGGPTGKIYYRILVPDDRKLYYKADNIQLTPQIRKKDGVTEYIVEQHDVPAIVSEPDTPGWFDKTPGFWLSEYSTWQQVGQLSDRMFSVSKQLSPEINKKVTEIKNSHSTDEARALAALRFVQEEVRYLGLEIGLNSHYPYPPARVFQQRFGDCKDKSVLLCTLLEQLGISARPALVNTRFRKAISTWQPGPKTFDHCVVRIWLSGMDVWVDPTLTNQGGNLYHTFFPDYGVALVIGESGKGLVPIKFNGTGGTHVTETFSMKEIKGSVTLHVETRFTGVEADSQRDLLLNNPVSEYKRNCLQYYQNLFPGTLEAHDLLINDDKLANKLLIIEEYTLPDFWSISDSSSGSKLTAEVYPYLLRERVRKFPSSNRSTPYALEYPLDYEQTLVVHFPEKWTVESGRKITEGPGFRFTSASSADGNRVELNYRYESTTNYIGPKEIPSYLSKQKKMFENAGMLFTHTPGQSAGNWEPNWWLILLCVVMLSVVGWFGLKVYRNFDPVPEAGLGLRPRDITGWLVLPAIGIWLAPVGVIYTLLSQGYFNKAVWDVITTSNLSTYRPGLAAFVVVELIVNTFLLGYCVLNIILLIHKRSSLPIVYIIFLAFNACFILIDNTAAVALQVEGTTFDWILVSRTIISALIWGVYFNKSKRVKRTFVVMRNPPIVAKQDLTLTEEMIVNLPVHSGVLQETSSDNLT